MISTFAILIQIISAILKSFEGVFLGNDSGDYIVCLQHVQGLRLDDGHQNLRAARLDVFDGFFHSVKTALVHK